MCWPHLTIQSGERTVGSSISRPNWDVNIDAGKNVFGRHAVIREKWAGVLASAGPGLSTIKP